MVIVVTVVFGLAFDCFDSLFIILLIRHSFHLVLNSRCARFVLISIAKLTDQRRLVISEFELQDIYDFEGFESVHCRVLNLLMVLLISNIN